MLNSSLRGLSAISASERLGNKPCKMSANASARLTACSYALGGTRPCQLSVIGEVVSSEGSTTTYFLLAVWRLLRGL